MNINMRQVLRTIRGEPIWKSESTKDKPGELLLLDDVAANGLMANPSEGPGRFKYDGKARIRRWELAEKCLSAEYVDLSSEEIVEIKQAIEEAYPSVAIYAQACKMLEGKQDGQAKKE